MEKLLCPSIMCADFGDLPGEIARLEACGSDIFHLDVMDGQFVPNFGLGLQDIEYVCAHASIPCDVHLMTLTPGDYVELFAGLGARIIYAHAETGPNLPRTLEKIRSAGASPGLAINPGTAAATVEPLLNLVDYVLVMTVNPGFAGQAYLPYVEEKIDRLVDWKARYGYRVILDGACSPEVIARQSARGVDGFVLGTSALFHKGRPFSEIFPELRAL